MVEWLKTRGVTVDGPVVEEGGVALAFFAANVVFIVALLVVMIYKPGA